MSGIDAGDDNIEPNAPAHEPLPPLGIRHLLMFTTGIALALAIITPLAQSMQSQQTFWESSLILIARAPLGLSATFLFWLASRAYRKKQLPLVDPGAKFAAMLSGARLVSTTTMLLTLALIVSGQSFAFNWLMTIFYIARLLMLLAGAILGIIWIKEPAWRVVLICQALGMMFCLFPFTTAIAAPALVYAYLQDVRAKRSRHWTHYFGVILWAFSQLTMI